MDTIKMDNVGYEIYLKKIKEIEVKLSKVRKYKGEEAIYQGDNWHDNPTLYSTELEEKKLMKQLYDMREQLKYIEIIEKNLDKSIVEIGDIINISLSVANNEPEQMLVKLVGYAPDLDAKISEISINSPLGAAIYKKHVGDTNCYNVGERHFNVTILNKIIIEIEKEKAKIK